ncbi:AAA family ATPase [Catellatospora chokoriensis]|uniref:ATPase AAA n=1 Tax=Catellatospora chokoriensis TaxID=310353 RepID=A0A8J3NN72_9ACTN|nr:ATP-binding protein [Catellatospora chokoriensis]GIF86680.1 ATPase AAA [Catellatospora chokoriensis]
MPVTPAVPKPGELFDRVHEWNALSGFVSQQRQAAALGLVYGRRRQGKTFLLSQLARATGGFMFTAAQQAADQNLAALSTAYHQFTGQSPAQFAGWPDAIDGLLRLGERAPVTVVLDEFSYLLDSVDGIASHLQIALEPHHRGGSSQARLILCGSAMTTMRNVLGGTAPLRGRASLELLVHPLGYRDAATFWGARDPELAFRINALVGGTPAYPAMSETAPHTLAEFDGWVVDRLLNPASVMFHEGDVLLRQQTEIADPALYFSVLAAISRGAHRRSEIANALGRPDTALGHPLAVLESVRLIDRADDAFRQQRPSYRIAEPLIRFHQLVIVGNDAAFALRQGERVWQSKADTVSSKIYGPHLEQLAREWTQAHAAEQTVGGWPNQVRSAVVACREHGQGHEVDVVAMREEPLEPRRVLAIGEVKATAKPVGETELHRLRHVRDLLPGNVTPEPVRLLLFSRAGFTPALRRLAAEDPGVELVGLDRLYHGE